MDSIARKVMMIRPETFRSNEETSASNPFQNEKNSGPNIIQNAQKEFDQFQKILADHGIEVLSFEEKKNADTPDALFPNNWFCSLPDERIFLFPMMAENRRRECRIDLLKEISPKSSFTDLRNLEKKSYFLEGTGSLVLDHKTKTGYACLSPRTHVEALHEFETKSDYKVFYFVAADPNGQPIYHTNVVMALGNTTAVLYADGIQNRQEREELIEKIQSSSRQLILINQKQFLSFAGNILMLQNDKNEKFWIASSGAVDSLTLEQKNILEADGKIISVNLHTIESVGGGSARCMLAEIF